MFGNAENKKLKQEKIHREIFNKQQQIQKVYQKRLSGKNMNALTQFANSGKQPGSSDFYKLHPMVQEVVLKLNMSGVEVMQKNTINPLKKMLFGLQMFMFKRLAKGEVKKAVKAKIAKKAKKS